MLTSVCDPKTEIWIWTFRKQRAESVSLSFCLHLWIQQSQWKGGQGSWWASSVYLVIGSSFGRVKGKIDKFFSHSLHKSALLSAKMPAHTLTCFEYSAFLNSTQKLLPTSFASVTQTDHATQLPRSSTSVSTTLTLPCALAHVSCYVLLTMDFCSFLSHQQPEDALRFSKIPLYSPLLPTVCETPSLHKFVVPLLFKFNPHLFLWSLD